MCVCVCAQYLQKVHRSSDPAAVRSSDDVFMSMPQFFFFLLNCFPCAGLERHHCCTSSPPSAGDLLTHVGLWGYRNALGAQARMEKKRLVKEWAGSVAIGRYCKVLSFLHEIHNCIDNEQM